MVKRLTENIDSFGMPLFEANISADQLIDNWGNAQGEDDMAKRFRDTGYDFNSLVPHVIDHYDEYKETMIEPKDIAPNAVKSWLDPMSKEEEVYAQEYSKKPAETAPPVVLRPSTSGGGYKWQVVDGRHRIRAAAIRGGKVKAAIPIGKSKV